MEDPVAGERVITALAQLNDVVNIRDELTPSALASSQLGPRNRMQHFFRQFSGAKAQD